MRVTHCHIFAIFLRADNLEFELFFKVINMVRECVIVVSHSHSPKTSNGIVRIGFSKARKTGGGLWFYNQAGGVLELKAMFADCSRWQFCHRFFIHKKRRNSVRERNMLLFVHLLINIVQHRMYALEFVAERVTVTSIN